MIDWKSYNKKKEKRINLLVYTFYLSDKSRRAVLKYQKLYNKERINISSFVLTKMSNIATNNIANPTKNVILSNLCNTLGIKKVNAKQSTSSPRYI